MDVEKQILYANRIKDLIVNIVSIDAESYVSVIDAVPPGLVSKLRLTPDSSLGKKLDHLYRVCEIATGSINPILTEGVSLESMEGLSAGYPEDCDIILRGNSTGIMYFIDVTSSRDESILADKLVKLNKLCEKYDNGFKNTMPLINFFESDPFSIDIDLIKNDNNPETPLLRMIETVTKMSKSTREKFFDNIEKLYSMVLPSLSETDHVKELYKIKKPNDKLYKASVAALDNNDADKIIKLIKVPMRKTSVPYIEAMQRLTAQFHTRKYSFRYPAARISKHSDLQTALSSLKDDLFCFSLFTAYNLSGKVIMMRKDRSYSVLENFPDGISTSKVLPIESGYSYAVKHVDRHIFTIKFSYDEMDNNLRRILLKENSPKVKIDYSTKSSIEAVANKILETEQSIKMSTRDMFRKCPETTMSTIWDKMNSMCDLVSKDLGAIGVVSTNMLLKLSSIIKRTNLGALIGQRYEVANTFAASLKSSSKGSNFYVGVNGPYDSISIVKMNSTQDSYKNRHYCVIGRTFDNSTNSSLVKPCKMSHKSVFRSEFYTMNHNELVYELKIPHVFMSLLTWDVENNLKGSELDELIIPDIIASNALHTIVNRDVFAQSSEQVRYFYMSSIGYGSKPEKITEKFNFFTPKYDWEFLYMIRMIKMGLSLSCIRDYGSFSNIIVEGELPVAFPNSRLPVKSFSQAVSSMYYCNVFNKFRAFHEVAASICYNELDEENEIYKKHVLEFRQDLAGISKETEDNCCNKKYLCSEEFIQNESRFARSLASSAVGRFKASAIFIMSATMKHIKLPSTSIDKIYSEIGSSPISACTMRGSMDHKESTDSHQAIRAASTVLEQLMIDYGFDPDVAVKNSLASQIFVDNVKNNPKDFSILSIVIRQIISNPTYRYRITPKDQKGHREISVLNAAFRIAALMYEKIATVVSDSIRKYDILENPNKDIIFEDAVSKAVNQTEYSTIFFDNSDQKRWGPNHMLHLFSAMMCSSLRSEPGLCKILNFISQKVLHKRAKFPESLIMFYKKRIERKTASKEELITLGSDAMSTFFKKHYDDMKNSRWDTEFKYGMCQGIFHATSSVLHAVLLGTQEDVINLTYGDSIRFNGFATSDDATRIIMSKNSDMHSEMKFLHNSNISIGNLFCIIRNDSKSAYNPHIGELNSTFYKAGNMATPSIKQRVSKLDAGSGENHYEDFLSALSNASNYFASGGSYSGSIILSVLNLVIHTEQWNRWEFCNMSHFYKSVELGGFPVVEPFSTMLSGAISNIYLRVSNKVSEINFSKYHASNLTTEPSEFHLNDFWRTDMSKKLEFDPDLKILRNSGMMGLFSCMRTDKKLSMFERRNKMSKWIIPDEFSTLRKNSSNAAHFIFNLSRTADMTLHDTPEGINSFYLRYTDPWVSESRKIYKISKNSILTKIGFDTETRVSISDIRSRLLKMTLSESDALINDHLKSEDNEAIINLLAEQLSVKLKDSKVIFKFISDQECEHFIAPYKTPTIIKLALKGNTEDDKFSYLLSLVKHLSGSKSRDLITQATGNFMSYDLLPTKEIESPISIKNSIIMAENTINVFNKFVKSSTKLICSGKPADLSAVVQLVLSNRFTETAGVRLVGKIRIPGDMSNTFSYTGWYRDLTSKSKQKTSEHANKVWNRTYAEVVKYGVRSISNVIGPHENFEVVESPEPYKLINLNPKRRSDLTKSVRDWSTARVNFKLSDSAYEDLMSGRLLSRNEFLYSNGLFKRFCSDGYFNIEIDHKSSLHFITTNIKKDTNMFKHSFYYKAESLLMITKFEVSPNLREKVWAAELIAKVQKLGVLKPKKNYLIGTDIVEFIPISSNTLFEPIIDKASLTTSMVFEGGVIPVCHVSSTSIKHIDSGYKITHSNIMDACLSYKSLADDSDNFNVMNEKVKNILETVLFKSKTENQFRKIENAFKSMGHNFKFSAETVDILRTLMISDNSLDVTISSSRMFNCINNLCEESNSNSSYIMSVKLDSKLIAQASPEFNNTLSIYDFMQTDMLEEMEDSEEEVMFDDSSEYEEDVDLDFASDGEIEINFDDLDFEEEDIDDIFASINKTAKVSKDIEQMSRSVRTNHSLNPVDEYPNEIINYCHDWLSGTEIKSSVGRGFKIKNVIDLIRYYSSLVFAGQESITDLVKINYDSDFIKTPVPMSMLAAMDIS